MKRRWMGAALQVVLGVACGSLAMASVLVHRPSLGTWGAGSLLVMCGVLIAGFAPYAAWAFIVANLNDSDPRGSPPGAGMGDAQVAPQPQGNPIPTRQSRMVSNTA